MPSLTSVYLIKDAKYQNLSYLVASVTTYRVDTETATAEIETYIAATEKTKEEEATKAAEAAVKSGEEASANRPLTTRERYYDEARQQAELRKLEEEKRIAEEQRRTAIRTYKGNITVPDAVLAAFLYGRYDTNGDGELSGTEARAVKTMDCSRLGLTSVEGLEYFSSPYHGVRHELFPRLEIAGLLP